MLYPGYGILVYIVKLKYITRIFYGVHTIYDHNNNNIIITFALRGNYHYIYIRIWYIIIVVLLLTPNQFFIFTRALSETSVCLRRVNPFTRAHIITCTKLAYNII